MPVPTSTNAAQTQVTKGVIEFQPATAMPETRILVVDDDRDIHVLLKSILAKAGYVVEGVSDGKKALACLESSRFDLRARLASPNRIPRPASISLGTVPMPKRSSIYIPFKPNQDDELSHAISIRARWVGDRFASVRIKVAATSSPMQPL
jgi:hypothetical protein